MWEAWEVQASCSGAGDWQRHMLPYLERKDDAPAQAAARDGPAALAGRLASAPADESVGGDRSGRSLAAMAACGMADYPRGGYWGLAAGARVAMLHALVHDALDTWHFRHVVWGMGCWGWGGRGRESRCCAFLHACAVPLRLRATDSTFLERQPISLRCAWRSGSHRAVPCAGVDPRMAVLWHVQLLDARVAGTGTGAGAATENLHPSSLLTKYRQAIEADMETTAEESKERRAEIAQARLSLAAAEQAYAWAAVSVIPPACSRGPR